MNMSLQIKYIIDELKQYDIEFQCWNDGEQFITIKESKEHYAILCRNIYDIVRTEIYEMKNMYGIQIIKNIFYNLCIIQLTNKFMCANNHIAFKINTSFYESQFELIDYCFHYYTISEYSKISGNTNILTINNFDNIDEYYETVNNFQQIIFLKFF